MAEDILDEINDDLDHDVMEDSLENTMEDFPDEIGSVEKNTSKKKRFVKLRTIFKQLAGSKKAILIMAVVVILLMALTFSAWMFFLKTGTKDSQEVSGSIPAGQAVNDTQAREDEVVFEDIIDLEPFERIQLKSGSSMPLVNLTLSLELIDHRDRKLVYTMEERIRKIITGQVQEMTWRELRNPEGKIMLKYNLLKRMNSIFPNPMIRNIYFTTFIMQ